MSESQFLSYIRRINKIKGIPDIYATNSYEKGLRLFNENKILKSLSIFKKLVLNYKYNARFNFWLARCYHEIIKLSKYYSRNDFETSDFYYRRAISVSPSNASFHSNYALFSVDWVKYSQKTNINNNKQIYISKSKQAIKHFEKSLQISSLPTVHFNYAKFLDEILDKYNNAEIHYKIALNTFSNIARYRLNYARLLYKMCKYNESYKQFLYIFNIEKENNNKNIWHHYHFGILLKSMNKYNESISEFELCIKLKPYTYSEIYFEYALLLIDELNDIENGLYYLHIACNISPSRKHYQKIYYAISHRLNNEKQNDNDDDDKQEEEEENKENKQHKEEKENKENKESEDNSDNNSIIDESLTNRYCESEWDRFITKNLNYNGDFEQYCDKFEDEQINDIRWLLTQKVLRDDFLHNIIGMDDNAIIIWKNSVLQFNNEHNKYIKILKNNNLYTKYYEKFKRYAILNFESFFYHIECKNDILDIIGNKNINDANFIWQCANKTKNNKCF